MNCIQCGGNNYNDFFHNVFVDNEDNHYVKEFPIKYRKIKNVICYKCNYCGCLSVNRIDLNDKIKQVYIELL